MFEDLLGLPLSEGEAILKKRGITPAVVRYVSKRDIPGADDWRILRCTLQKPGVAEVVAGVFCTDVDKMV